MKLKGKQATIMALLAVAIVLTVQPTMATTVTVDFDISDGELYIEHVGKDWSSWHRGQTGEINTFEAQGSFQGEYCSSTGKYGSLWTRINAESHSPAWFHVSDYQDFNVLSANHIYNTEGYFDAWAIGDPAELNMKFVGSMYVWSEATEPWSAKCLKGNIIEKWTRVYQSGVLQAELDLWITTNGTAYLCNSNIWGWGINEHGRAFTDYGGGTRTFVATGTGQIEQYGFGNDYLEFNGFTFPAGATVWLQGTFNNGASGTYDMEGD